MVTDTVGDFIIRLKNANFASKESASLYISKAKEAIAEALVRLGYLKSASKSKNGKMLEIEFLYNLDGSPKINNIKRLSKPSRRIYKKFTEIKPLKSNFGAIILSTPKGILSDKEAYKEKIGGEVMFKIW